MQNSLEDAKLRLVDLKDLCRKLGKLNEKAEGLETQVGELTKKVMEAKEVDVTQF